MQEQYNIDVVLKLLRDELANIADFSKLSSRLKALELLKSNKDISDSEKKFLKKVAKGEVIPELNLK